MVESQGFIDSLLRLIDGKSVPRHTKESLTRWPSSGEKFFKKFDHLLIYGAELNLNRARLGLRRFSKMGPHPAIRCRAAGLNNLETF